ncbi:hypothetical protein C8D83_105114, partial [Halothiobacillus neapolitanus]
TQSTLIFLSAAASTAPQNRPATTSQQGGELYSADIFRQAPDVTFVTFIFAMRRLPT